MKILSRKKKFVLGMTFLVVVSLALYWVIMYKRSKHVVRLSDYFTIPAGRIHKHVLSNGMHVLIFKNTSLPKVLVQIAYDVGSYVEDSGERGLAHLVEHMIFKGTEKMSETDIDSIARKYGASFNAFTSYDVTSYYFEANRNNWKPFLPILADCMQNCRFDEQHLASELKAVVQELKMQRDNYWKTMVVKACELVFPSNHPYHTPIIGFKEDLVSLRADNLKKFYKKYYRPDRATLFIVGDVDEQEALQMAKDHFEPLVAEKGSVVKPFPTVIPELVTHHTRYFEDVKKEQLGFYWIIPGIKSEIEHISSALESLLGTGQSSRLHHGMIDDKKIATSVTVKAAKFMEAGVFMILVEPMPGATEACEQFVRSEFESIIKDGVGEQEIERVAKHKSKKFFKKMQDHVDFVYNWIKSYFSTQDEFDIFKRVYKYYQITSPQIQEFVKKYLDPFLMNRIEVLPLPDQKHDLKTTIKRLSDDIEKKILASHQRTTPVEEPKLLYSMQSPEALTFTFPKPERTLELPNGLRVLLAPRRYVPLVALTCQFKDAEFLDSAKEGIGVGFMMHMLMEGSHKYSKTDNVDFFEQLGATYSFTDEGARFNCLRHDFEKLIERFYHILTQPTFPSEGIEKVQHIFIDNYQRAKDSPKLTAVRILKNMIYKGHPFAWTYDEACSIVKHLNTRSLQELHAQYVCPANMSIAIVGDFDLDSMVSLITKVFGSWPTGIRKEFPKNGGNFEKRAFVDHAMLRDQVIFLLGQPSPLTIYDADLIPLKLLNIVCFRSLGSRIFKLREQTGLFYSAFGGYAVNAVKEHGFDYVGMIVSPENVATAEQQTRHLLELVTQKGVTESEIDAARQMYLKDLIDLVTSDNAIAYLLCSLDSLGLGFDYYDKVLNRVQTMTVEEVNAIAAKYCKPDDMARVRVGPALRAGK